jgi:polyhydroxybutyrate depolymerase
MMSGAGLSSGPMTSRPRSGYVRRVLGACLLSFAAAACGNSPNGGDSNANGGADSTSGGSAGNSGTGAAGADAGGAQSSGGTDLSGGTAGSTSGGSGGSASAVVGTEGCGKVPAETGPLAQALTVAGQSRTFAYIVPEGYSPDEPLPVVFGFHGAGGNSLQPVGWGLNVAAYNGSGQRALFIYPNALVRGGRTGWAMGEDEEDVQLFDAMLEWAEAEFCVNPKRIFLVGFSWGNDFANVLGCYRGDKVRAINGFSGGFYSDNCTPETPAYRATYSTPDGSDAYSQEAMDEAVHHYRDALGCDDTTEAIDPEPCLAYQGCEAPVIFCGYPHMGHAVPKLGGWDAWNFFASFE